MYNTYTSNQFRSADSIYGFSLKTINCSENPKKRLVILIPLEVVLSTKINVSEIGVVPSYFTSVTLADRNKEANFFLRNSGKPQRNSRNMNKSLLEELTKQTVTSYLTKMNIKANKIPSYKTEKNSHLQLGTPFQL